MYNEKLSLLSEVNRIQKICIHVLTCLYIGIAVAVPYEKNQTRQNHSGQTTTPTRMRNSHPYSVLSFTFYSCIHLGQVLS